MVEVDLQAQKEKPGYGWSPQQKSGQRNGKTYVQVRLPVANDAAMHVGGAKEEGEEAEDASVEGADLDGDTPADDEEVASELEHTLDGHEGQEGPRDRNGSAFPAVQAPTCASAQIRECLGDRVHGQALGPWEQTQCAEI